MGECQSEGYFILIVVASGIGFVILSALVTLCCRTKCAFYFNLTLNTLIIIFLTAFTITAGVLDYASWAIAGGLIGGLIVLLAFVVGGACCWCSDDGDYDSYYGSNPYGKSKMDGTELKQYRGSVSSYGSYEPQTRTKTRGGTVGSSDM